MNEKSDQMSAKRQRDELDETVRAKLARMLDMGPVLVTTSRGVEVECLPIINLLDSVEASVEYPDPPTYVATDASGVEIERPHNEESIEDERTTDEEKAQWAQYLEACAEADQRKNMLRLRVMAARGIRLADESLWERWAAEERAWGIRVPEDESELRFHLFVNEVVGNPTDTYLLTMGIYRAGGADEEVLDAIEKSFRSPVEGAEGAAAGGNQAKAKRKGAKGRAK